MAKKRKKNRGRRRPDPRLPAVKHRPKPRPVPADALCADPAIANPTVAPRVGRFVWDEPDPARAARAAELAAAGTLPAQAERHEHPEEPAPLQLEEVHEPLPPELAPAAPGEDLPEPDARITRPKPRVAARFAGGVVMVLGLVFSGWIGTQIRQDAASPGWPTVAGKVTVSQSRLVSRNPDRYTHHFIYEYKVGSTWHTSHRVRFAGGQGDPTKEHRVGDAVKVRVSPDDPSAAVLEPGVIEWAWGQLFFGGVVAGLGGVYMVLGRIGRVRI